MKRYHDEYPEAPQALVAGLAGTCSLPSIIGARVGRDGSIYLDIYQGDFKLNPFHLLDIAEFCSTEIEDVEIESGPRPDTITVTVCNSAFDFSAQFREERVQLPGEEDSEESVEALAALALARRQ